MKRTTRKFDKKLNMDTATAEKIQKTNEELHKYLQQKGESTAAEQVGYLIKNQKSDSDGGTSVNNNKTFVKLLTTNQKILEVMRKIQADMVDEQDTSVKRVEKKEKEKEQTVINNYITEVKEDVKDGGLGIDFDRRRRGQGKDKKSKGGTGKPTTGKVPSGPVGIPTPGTPAPSEPDKPKKTSKTSTGKASGKATGKVASKGAGILKKMTMFLKPIPLLGTAIAAATAAYAAADGWEHASEITGVPEDNLTTSHKLAAAAGAVVGDFTFGIVKPESVAGVAMKFIQPNDIKETLKKYTEEKIIEDNIIGNDEVLDWGKLEKLPSYEIEKIIGIDDWSDDDKKKLWEANKRSAEREAVQSNETFLTEQGVKKNVEAAPQVQRPDSVVTPGGAPSVPGKPGGTTSAPSGGAPSVPGKPGTTSGGAPTQPAQVGTGKYTGVSGAPIPNAEQSKAPIISVEDFGGGWNVVKRSDGTIEKRIGNRNWRNNNPGNVEFGSFTQKHGALSGDPRFAIFPTYEAGRNAKRELIFQGKNYTNLSLSQAIARYAPPSENNTNAYIAGVLGAVGGIEKFMKDYVTSEQDAILNAMQRIEGWVVGRVELIEKGTGTVEAQKSTPTANTPAGAPASSGVSSGGGMNIQPGGEFSGPASVKQTSSGVTKGGTTTANVTTGNVVQTAESSKPMSQSAQVSKTPREELIQQSSTNLVTNTKQYDSSKSVGGGSSSTSNTNINNTNRQAKQDYGQDRILNYFS